MTDFVAYLPRWRPSLLTLVVAALVSPSVGVARVIAIPPMAMDRGPGKTLSALMGFRR